MYDLPGSHQIAQGAPSPKPPCEGWAKAGYLVFFQMLPYFWIAMIVALPFLMLNDITTWPWRWHAAGVVVAMLVVFTAVVIWRRRKAWDQTLLRRRAAKECPGCGYDLIDVVHPPASPGIPGQVARCPECGRGVRYIEPDPQMEELARAHSRRNDAATDNAIASSRTAINGAISGGEDASV